MAGSGEAPAGQGMLGTDQLQSQVDSLSTSVRDLSSSLTDFVSQMKGMLGSVENGTTGAATASSGSSAGAKAGKASGTGSGGYSSWVSKLTTFGQRLAGGGSGVGSGGGYGSGGGSGFSTFGSSSAPNMPTAPGGSGGAGGAGGSVGSGSGGGWRSGVATGAALLQVGAAYGNRNINTFMTMNTSATQQMWNSGLVNGGVGASLSTATRMIYGSGGSNINATAASPQDAAAAAGLLSYGIGSPMYNSNGSPNSTWVAGQQNMYSMAYANPFMSQTQVAAASNSLYSPNSIRTLTALGYKLPATGALNMSTFSPTQVAQSIFSSTFGGKTAVSASTLAAALAPGESMNANLNYLAQSAGWSSGTVNMLSTYMQERNTAINNGANPSTLDSLMSQAASGSKSASSSLSQYGIGASTVQAIKNLQASQTSTLADQSGSFNDTLQSSTNLLAQFNQVLSAILSSTGASTAIGGAAGVGTAFGGMASAAGYLVGSGGGAGFAGGGAAGTVGGMGVSFGTSLLGASAAKYTMGKVGSAWNRLTGKGGSANAAGESTGSTVAAGEGESAAIEGADVAAAGGAAGADQAAVAAASAGGLSSGAALGLGALLGYSGTHLSDSLWTKVNGSSQGENWGVGIGKVASTTAIDAGAGALMGSVIGPEGTAAGAIIGGAVGLGHSLYDWISGGSSYTGGSAAQAQTSPGASAVGSSYTTGSIGGGTDSGTTSTSGPSSVTPAPGASGSTSATVAKVVAAACAQVGKPYVYGATGPDSFDCSGLMQFAYKAAGISIPRTSEQQMTAGSAVQPAAAQAGDLMFPNPGHVMMCIGGGKVVEARHTGTTIWIRSYSPSEFVAARRIIQLASSDATQNAGASGGNGATDSGNSATAMASGLSPAAGTSELQAISSNAQSALTDSLTASIKMDATETLFGLATLHASLTGGDPLAGKVGVGSGTNNSSSTPLNGTVRDVYGHTYKVPTGAKPPGTVASWINTALSIMGMTASTDTIGDIKDIITGESSGDPWSINLTDSNAAAGHPSEGIMQTIPTTFAAHALPNHLDIWNPVDDIIAGTRYAIATYKSLDNVPGVKAVKAGKPYVGYAAGAWDLPSDQVANVHKGEMILPATAAQSVRNAIISDSLGSTSSAAASSGGGVTLVFRPSSIQITMGQVSAQTAQQTGTAIVDAIVGDPRVKAMAVGM